MRPVHEIPSRAKPASDDGYLEMLTKAVFQAGFSWTVIRDKWPNFQEAFDGFDVGRVAAYEEEDIERLLRDAGIVRNGRKIVATVENARTVQRLSHEHGSFHSYLRSLDGLPYSQRRRTLTGIFKNLGPTGVFVFLHTVDEEVPSWDDRNS